MDSTFVHPLTNSGRKEVDIFAPGESIRTATAKADKYVFSYGTSASAAMVSKVVAIVLSYYPNLSVSKLKEIILKSGVEYELPVPRSGSEETNRLQPFSKLSKTGAVVNVYNALLLAEGMNKE